MLGSVTGDTIGSVYEFANTKDYDFELFRPGSSYTDDSVMTMAVAFWLLNDAGHSYQGLEDAMSVFAEEHPCPVGGYGGGFKTWLFSPERLNKYDNRLGECPYISRNGRHPYGSWGNGSSMRASAIGWFFDSLEETERVATISASITHNHPEGIKGAQSTAAAIFLARSGRPKEIIRGYIEATYGYDLQNTWEDWHPVYRWNSSCQGTVPQAMIAFLDSTDFEDAIRKAVSLGGDSDTLACITGGIAEAFYGGVPYSIAERVFNQLPDNFRTLFQQMWKRTSYGRVCPGYERLFK
jgi:ADP-ribosylglycohydrolase